MGSGLNLVEVNIAKVPLLKGLRSGSIALKEVVADLILETIISKSMFGDRAYEELDALDKRSLSSSARWNRHICRKLPQARVTIAPFPSARA